MPIVEQVAPVGIRTKGVGQGGPLQPVGSHADVVIFDEDRVASGALVTRFDLPAGAGRLYAEPVGVEHVLVNGIPIVTEGKLGDDRPGTLLRSGRDTHTPDLG